MSLPEGFAEGFYRRATQNNLPMVAGVPVHLSRTAPRDSALVMDDPASEAARAIFAHPFDWVIWSNPPLLALEVIVDTLRFEADYAFEAAIEKLRRDSDADRMAILEAEVRAFVFAGQPVSEDDGWERLEVQQ